MRPRAEVERGGTTLPVVLLQRLARHEGVAKLLGAAGALQERRMTCAQQSQWATVVPQAVRGTVGPRRAASGPNLLQKLRA